MTAPAATRPTSSDAALRADLKGLIVTTLRLESVAPADISDDELLFGPEAKLGLDSLAALELLSAIEFTYGVRFGDDGSARQHFQSVATLAAFVASARG